MTYRCSDFADSILDALAIVVPEDAQDDPSAQADLALASIDKRVKRARIAELAAYGTSQMFRGQLLRAEHALREALQIIEILKGSQTLKEPDMIRVLEAHRIDDEAAP